MRLGVVADDITGAGDIGSMTAKAGYLTHIYASDAFEGASPAEVCILDTDSRLDEAAVAYDKVFAATRALQAAGCTRFFNKTCSVFRGNIGVAFDAMLDALRERFAVVVLGFPKNGRTTVDGIHYVHGERLEQSPFRHDPVHPMARSDLVGILQAQTERAVGLITHDVIARGSESLREAIDGHRARGGYVILDVPHQEVLTTIAAAITDATVLCGSSALAEVLPNHWPPPAPAEPPPALSGPASVLVVSGSLTPQTAAQIKHLVQGGIRRLELDTLKLFAPHERQQELERLADAASERLSHDEHVLVHAANDARTVQQTQARGMAAGLSRAAASRLVSQALAEVTATCRGRAGLVRLVVAGGDTSATVCRRLGVRGMRIHREIRPGLPSCFSLGETPMLLILKSGSFGGPEFLEEAIKHVQEDRL
jgi:uncharacterized protein YgbK (DUF1537 family)